jgi:precorrin-6B methylase 1
MSKGSLSCVGIGMTLGAHITPIAREHISTSDVCFVAVSDALVEIWVSEMHSDVRSLQIYYAENKSRKQTYREMIDAVLTEVKAGKKVCGVFYGHPGVFAYVPHQMIKLALDLGHKAIMEPGISAEDCLIADLAIDPGKYGCQQYEASQFMFYKRIIDPSAYLILWQIGVAGDLNYGVQVTGRQYRKLLLSLLYEYYQENHQVILYEAATSPLKKIRAERIFLSQLVNVELKDYTTLVIPPAYSMQKNTELIEKIKAISID